MKKTTITLLSLVIILIFLWVSLVTGIENIVTKEENKFKEKIGLKIVIEKDTLLITDYSIITESFKLSNNTEVSYELVKKYKLIK